MATRVNAHEERLATLNSVMNVISVLDQSAPRRTVTDRWLDLRALLPAFETEHDGDDNWAQFLAPPAPRAMQEGEH